MLSRSADPRALLMDTPLQIPLVTPNVESHAVPGPIEKAAKVLFAFFISMVFMDVGWHLFSKESSGLLDLEPLAGRLASLLINFIVLGHGLVKCCSGTFCMDLLQKSNQASLSFICKTQFCLPKCTASRCYRSSPHGGLHGRE